MSARGVIPHGARIGNRSGDGKASHRYGRSAGDFLFCAAAHTENKVAKVNRLTIVLSVHTLGGDGIFCIIPCDDLAGVVHFTIVTILDSNRVGSVSQV